MIRETADRTLDFTVANEYLAGVHPLLPHALALHSHGTSVGVPLSRNTHVMGGGPTRRHISQGTL